MSPSPRTPCRAARLALLALLVVPSRAALATPDASLGPEASSDGARAAARWQRLGVSSWCPPPIDGAHSAAPSSATAPVAQVCRRITDAPSIVDADDAGGLRARAALVDDVLRMADRWGTARPRSAEPGARRARLQAHRAACDVALRFVLDVDAAVPARVTMQQRQELLEQPTRKLLPRRERACACARRSSELALAADAPVDEQAALARIVASDPCGARATAGPDGPSGPEALRDNADATAIAARTSALGVLREFALGRSLDVGRCRDRHTRNGRIAQRDKLEQCLCGVVRRWSLPRAREMGPVQGTLPIVDETLELGITVDAQGAVSSCGGLSGAALAP